VVTALHALILVAFHEFAVQVFIHDPIAVDVKTNKSDYIDAEAIAGRRCASYAIGGKLPRLRIFPEFHLGLLPL
jgi:hypothetical protein